MEAELTAQGVIEAAPRRHMIKRQGEVSDQVRGVPLTAIILTQDEALTIERCLRCLTSVDDVIIVDSGSADATLERARATRPQIRIFSHPFEDFASQRNWALSHTQPKHDWVLFVDADELCTPELMQEIAALLVKPDPYVGGFVAGKNYFLDRWLKHCTLYPVHQLRLLKRGHVTYKKHGHGQREVVDEPVIYLKESWRHEAFSKGVTEWIARHNNYSSQEIDLVREMSAGPLPWRDIFFGSRGLRGRALKRLSFRLPLRPLLTFLYLYIARRGFLDGYPGFLYCALMMGHHVNLMAKFAEQTYASDTQREAIASFEGSKRDVDR